MEFYEEWPYLGQGGVPLRMTLIKEATGIPGLRRLGSKSRDAEARAIHEPSYGRGLR